MLAEWLVTGCAGFIGFHLCQRLLADGLEVVGIDNLNDAYEPQLKHARLANLVGHRNFSFCRLDLRDGEGLRQVFEPHAPEVVVHLAARAGVRRSSAEPVDYMENNVMGFAQLLEACRRGGVRHLVYASSSSVYGATSNLPFSVQESADHPVGVYAASKRTNELQAHAYSHSFGLPTTGLRLFTVYGPWGRPDMAYFSFADAIRGGVPLTVYGDGSALRDFTYVDDIVEGVVRAAHRPPPASDASANGSPAPWRLFNIGHGGQATVNRLIELLEQLLGRPAQRLSAPLQPGEMRATQADTEDLRAHVGFTPQVRLEDGLSRFVEWLVRYRT